MTILYLTLGLIGGICITSLFFLQWRHNESTERAAQEALKVVNELKLQLEGREVPYKFRRTLEDNESGLDFILGELRRMALYKDQISKAMEEVGETAQKLMNENVNQRRTNK